MPPRPRNQNGQFAHGQDELEIERAELERGWSLARSPVNSNLTPVPSNHSPSRSPSSSWSRSRSRSQTPTPTPHPEINFAAIGQMTPQQMQAMMMGMMQQNQILMQENARRDRQRERREREDWEERRRLREVASLTPAPSKEKTPHVNHPVPFNGDSDWLEPFLTRCWQVFLLQSWIYPTENVKVAFMASFLCDFASAAVDPLLKAQLDGGDPPELLSVEAFSN